MDISKVTNQKANIFLESFLTNRKINREFYEKIPENKYDFRMVDTNKRKSDSPRESLTHQINVQRTYMLAVEKGKLKFGDYYNQELKAKTKKELLSKLKKADQELTDILTDEDKCRKKVKVPWCKQPIDAVDMFWALDQHEILHTGWNLAIMDHLNIKRFPTLKQMWG
jgi:uncharacterized damage-inducible protein DinB